MPRAEPALSRAPLPLLAVVGAATLRGRGSPHPLRPAARRRKAARKRGQGLRRADHPPATPAKAQGLTWYYGTLTATTLGTHGPKGDEWRGGRRL